MIRIESKDDEGVSIWTEPEAGDREVGRCIGVGKTIEEARECAIKELREDLHQLGHVEIQEGAGSFSTEEFLEASKRHGDHILQFFAYAHLPEPLRFISRQYGAMALDMVNRIPRNPERTVMLRKLLEAKDAAVRGMLSKI